MIEVGFATNDITPRVGVELTGFGPFLNRHSVGVRDPLSAKAMALASHGRRALIISCDLAMVTADITRKVRALLHAACGLTEDEVMLCATHTHSCPAVGDWEGWGVVDLPYLETLPQRIARAGIKAVEALQEATFAHAEVPCEHIGLNREYDRDAQPLEDVLQNDWRPALPQLTDTTCHVLTARTPGGTLIGFVSYFGCHPVVCSASNRHFHGDFVSIANNAVERDNDGAVGLFLQGAEGDVNSCVVHKPEEESLRALDVIADRFAVAVRSGIADAQPFEADRLQVCRRVPAFSRKRWSKDELRQSLRDCEAKLSLPDPERPGAEDDPDIRLQVVYATTLRKLLARMERGENLEPGMELHGLRIGPVAILGSPFETFQAIKNDVCAAASAPIPLVVSLVNESCGYAPDRTCAERGGYATDMVPMIHGTLPFVNVHEELVRELLALDAQLSGQE